MPQDAGFPQIDTSVRFNTTTDTWEINRELPLTIWERLNAADEFVKESQWQPLDGGQIETFTQNVVQGFKPLAVAMKDFGEELTRVGRSISHPRSQGR